jgi:DNA-binding transcriptional MerR regulator
VTGKSDEAIRTIGEVAESLDLPQHVLRFWETRFKEIDPIKRAGGRRFYRARDVELVSAIRCLLYREGYTIKGVQRILKEQGAGAVIEQVRGRAAALPATPPPAVVADRQPELEFPGPAPAVEIEEEKANEAAPSEPGDPEAAPATPLAVIVQPAALEPRAPTAEQARRLRQALAEIGECRRLLTLTRR